MKVNLTHPLRRNGETLEGAQDLPEALARQLIATKRATAAEEKSPPASTAKADRKGVAEPQTRGD